MQHTSAKGPWKKTVGIAARHPVFATLVYIVLVSAFFLVFPGVDRAVSAIFYDGNAGFWATRSPFLNDLRRLGLFLVKLVAVASVAVLLLKLAFPDRKSVAPLRAPLFLLSTLILAPGIVVNAILKDNWGRPRPRNVDIFGGDMPYVPVWHVTDYCDANCSFVSGEASSSIWLLSLAFLAPKPWRAPVAAAVLVLAAALSLNRVAFGGHFLSDTLISWGITFLILLIAYRIFYAHPPEFLTEAALERGFSRAGQALRRGIAKTASRIRSGFARWAGKFGKE
ncbi:phosphatase PAP2 family protein [Stappia sp. GBMRC 2046]|uniref:Phosphatase PAP2 family protein n=1 Tax=Stappia sediminis TaxID=2692190 RepID=A0A7X3LTY7_9HYPH|nr:phosphatase PAP2 family protein [Stappia sediminis]MXN65067.1 phosphatase PAP2 family protein [Stappia sediminis]